MHREFRPRQIFISYRKIIRRRAGIFGKRIDFLPTVTLLSNVLKKQGFNTFFDQNIGASEAWFANIAEQVVASELLLLLLTRDTLRSHWVRSEVHFAEAMGIRILPLGCGITLDEVALELKTAGLSHIQGIATCNHVASREADLWQEIGPHVMHAAEKTRKEQPALLSSIVRVRSQRQPAKPDQSRKQFELTMKNGARATLHLAAGDLAHFRHLSIIVNSENTLMQMARLIDGKTVSGMLRETGCQLSPRVDVLQRELDAMVDLRLREHGQPLPVPLGDVVMTSSGSPRSALASNSNTRYVFHVAAVEVLSTGELIPMTKEGQIRSAVRNCFEALQRLVELRGVISPAGTPQRSEQEKLSGEPLQLDGMLIPLFGVGRGGLEPSVVAEVIGRELRDTLANADPAQYGGLQNLYLSVFFEDDVPVVSEAVKRGISQAKAVPFKGKTVVG